MKIMHTRHKLNGWEIDGCWLSLQAGSHCDFETITLLFAKGAGLEVCPGR